MARIGRAVRINGRVQGVFFRAWTASQAHQLGVGGWVRNCADGSVEAHLTGEQSAVDQLVERLRHGPPSARVDRLDIAPAVPQAGDKFEVRH